MKCLFNSHYFFSEVSFCVLYYIRSSDKHWDTVTLTIFILLSPICVFKFKVQCPYLCVLCAAYQFLLTHPALQWVFPSLVILMLMDALPHDCLFSLISFSLLMLCLCFWILNGKWASFMMSHMEYGIHVKLLAQLLQSSHHVLSCMCVISSIRPPKISVIAIGSWVHSMLRNTRNNILRQTRDEPQCGTLLQHAWGPEFDIQHQKQMHKQGCSWY